MGVRAPGAAAELDEVCWLHQGDFVLPLALVLSDEELLAGQPGGRDGGLEQDPGLPVCMARAVVFDGDGDLDVHVCTSAAEDNCRFT